jgi:uncharacterized protein YbjT (DUF2867 family)
MTATPASPTSVFVTGGSGAAGLEAVRALVAAGYSVTGAVQGFQAAQRLRQAGALPAYPDDFRG